MYERVNAGDWWSERFDHCMNDLMHGCYVRAPVRPPARPPVRPSVCLPICLSVCLSVRLTVLTPLLRMCVRTCCVRTYVRAWYASVFTQHFPWFSGHDDVSSNVTCCCRGNLPQRSNMDFLCSPRELERKDNSQHMSHRAGCRVDLAWILKN